MSFFGKRAKFLRIGVIVCISVIIIALVTFFIVLHYDISRNEFAFIDKLYESEYFIYYDNDKEEQIHIVGLTDKGKEQEYLIIPEKINGKTVGKIGCYNKLWVNDIVEKYGDEKYAQIKSKNLKKIFLTSNVQIINARFIGKAIQSLKYEGTMFILNTSSWSGEKVYCSSYATTNKYFMANVSYFYNYENSPNDGYYWIDNYDYGEKVEFIPPVPTRAGYTFGGWYKERECINEWNFEIDRLPDYLFNEGTPPDPENYRPIYQETKLYAKWIEQEG